MKLLLCLFALKFSAFQPVLPLSRVDSLTILGAQNIAIFVDNQWVKYTHLGKGIFVRKRPVDTVNKKFPDKIDWEIDLDGDGKPEKIMFKSPVLKIIHGRQEVFKDSVKSFIFFDLNQDGREDLLVITPLRKLKAFIQPYKFTKTCIVDAKKPYRIGANYILPSIFEGKFVCKRKKIYVRWENQRFPLSPDQVVHLPPIEEKDMVKIITYADSFKILLKLKTQRFYKILIRHKKDTTLIAKGELTPGAYEFTYPLKKNWKNAKIIVRIGEKIWEQPLK